MLVIDNGQLRMHSYDEDTRLNFNLAWACVNGSMYGTGMCSACVLHHRLCLLPINICCIHALISSYLQHPRNRLKRHDRCRPFELQCSQCMFYGGTHITLTREDEGELEPCCMRCRIDLESGTEMTVCEEEGTGGMLKHGREHVRMSMSMLP